GVRHPVLGHLLGDGDADLVDDALHAAFRQPRQRSVGTHAAGVRASIALTDALEVLRRDQRDNRLAVHQAEQGDLRTIQEAFQQHRVAAGVDVVDVGARGSTVVGDDDSLTRGQAVVLHDEARTETVQGPLNLRIRRTRLQGLRRGGSDPGARHDVLRESLGPLDLGRSLGRAEDRESCPRQSATTPATSGISGPITTRSTPSSWARPTGFESSGWSVAMAFIPGLPGLTWTSETDSSRDRE